MNDLGIWPRDFGSFGDDAQLFDAHLSTFLKPEMIHIGTHARIDARVRIEGGLGCTIGDNVHVASGSSLNVGGGELIFGAHSGCSPNVVIATGSPDLSYLEVSPVEAPELVHTIRKKTVIGEYVVIFSGAIILPGVTIGKCAVIGAGAVVTSDVPDYAIVFGIPGRIVGDRRDKYGLNYE